MKKKKCYNCKFRSPAFKVGKVTHHHCDRPTYQKRRDQGEEISPWETLVVFSETCKEYEQ
jgi:hypothetical protein